MERSYDYCPRLPTEAECGAGAVQKLASSHRHNDAFTAGNHTAGAAKKFVSAHRHYDE
jgi:hypothetical protein